MRSLYFLENFDQRWPLTLSTHLLSYSNCDNSRTIWQRNVSTSLHWWHRLHNLKHGRNAAQCLGLKQSKASIRMYKCFISSHYWPLSFAYLIVYVLKIANVYVKICIFVFFMCKISYFVSFYVFCQSIFITKKNFLGWR